MSHGPYGKPKGKNVSSLEIARTSLRERKMTESASHQTSATCTSRLPARMSSVPFYCPGRGISLPARVAISTATSSLGLGSFSSLGFKVVKLRELTRSPLAS